MSHGAGERARRLGGFDARIDARRERILRDHPPRRSGPERLAEPGARPAVWADKAALERVAEDGPGGRAASPVVPPVRRAVSYGRDRPVRHAEAGSPHPAERLLAEPAAGGGRLQRPAVRRRRFGSFMQPSSSGRTPPSPTTTSACPSPTCRTGATRRSSHLHEACRLDPDAAPGPQESGTTHCLTTRRHAEAIEHARFALRVRAELRLAAR